MTPILKFSVFCAFFRCRSTRFAIPSAGERVAGFLSRRRLCRLFGLLFLASLSWPAMAWNAAGHRLIASIAWQQLDPLSRSAIGRLLRQHPDYALWQARGRGDDDELNAFVESSTWADDIRQDPRFYSSGETPTPTLAGFPDMQRRRHWHYVDWPIPASRVSTGLRSSDGVLDRQLAALIDTLGQRRASTAERVYALPWLIHLVGDAHQPLHAASRFSADGVGDRGGNELAIENPFVAPPDSASNLHHYWDSLPGAPWLRGEHLARKAETLLSRYPFVDRTGTPTDWLRESWRIAEREAYPPDSDAAVPVISAAFDARSREIAGQRLVQAGQRLATLLRRLFGDGGRR
ncbi:MAG TPA: S1/P1 nuclease [Accumulibacter sp.]|nr:S1/P1 nuclease [Accumulibacter sp.]HNG38082.1 S1/P1 nuclease [Accumulibacter sp.]HNI72607.1 S1/P1 nuclease [Accumulibacter sp.]